MKQGYFITGTDTNVGKTWVTVALMRYFKVQGLTVIGMKPVAAGCELNNNQLKNSDALLLQAEASIPLAYEFINPYAYEAPISPHLAGKHDPVQIDKIIGCFDNLRKRAEIILVEGAGGWYAPINDRQNISDIALALQLPVILVVAIRLGCINHALLSYQAIMRSGLLCAGWVAVVISPDSLCIDANIESLKQFLPTPLLGTMPYQSEANFDQLAEQFNFANNKMG